jgi:hypothetical protein
MGIFFFPMPAKTHASHISGFDAVVRNALKAGASRILAG